MRAMFQRQTNEEWFLVVQIGEKVLQQVRVDGGPLRITWKRRGIYLPLTEDND
uniref:Uncharacterized protein n=1 Tax=Physcomitrium patens TaxID=3218 RepID=A0A2K1KX26_PHYPA|nr:hypothetical protein PHYPA_005339 [Physcomitrium patens]PNR58345.1 hypothetical protein PHYPA_005340 [Physcomitrium patens]